MTSRERMHAAMRPAEERALDRIPVMCQLAIGHYFLHTNIPAVEIWHDSSEMTNRIAEMLVAAFAASGSRALPYSPGYCGWHVSGQRALFDVVKPADIGVSLGKSCLMRPLKSVSGVAVVGDRNTHRFKPQWTFCHECATKDCGPRMASVR